MVKNITNKVISPNQEEKVELDWRHPTEKSRPDPMSGFGLEPSEHSEKGQTKKGICPMHLCGVKKYLIQVS